MLSTFVVTAVEIGAIGAACDVAQTATETTAVTAIAIGNRFMLSSLDKLPPPPQPHRAAPQMNAS